MATWVVHLRIADYFLKQYKNLSTYEFVVGNLAHDCGYGEKDSFGEFTPPPAVTHWTLTGSKKDCRYKDFYKKYLKNRKHDTAYSFYLGYYVHLLTDIIWSSTICIPTYDKYAEEYKKNPEFLRVIKCDWNDLDYKYLNEHPKFKPYRIISDKRKEIPDFMPYYEHNQITNQIGFIADFYKTNTEKRNIYRKYEYLTEKQLNNFISLAPEIIKMNLESKNLL